MTAGYNNKNHHHEWTTMMMIFISASSSSGGGGGASHGLHVVAQPTWWSSLFFFMIDCWQTFIWDISDEEVIVLNLDLFSKNDDQPSIFPPYRFLKIICPWSHPTSQPPNPTPTPSGASPRGMICNKEVGSILPTWFIHAFATHEFCVCSIHLLLSFFLSFFLSSRPDMKEEKPTHIHFRNRYITSPYLLSGRSSSFP